MVDSPPFLSSFDELMQFIRGTERSLIVFDGRPNAGKSYSARRAAQCLDCTFLDGDHFIDGGNGMFVGALRATELKRAIEIADKQPVLLATVCARDVIGRLNGPAATVIWVEPASSLRLDQIRRDYFQYDDHANHGRRRPLYRETEDYIVAHNARHAPDAIYLNGSN